MKALFGVVGVYSAPDRIKSAAALLRERGYRAFETYTPYPVEGLGEIVHPAPRRALPLAMFAGAVIGAAFGYWIQYWDEAVSYPINVGGRPYDSWPAFTVSTFEFMVLFAVAFGFFGLLLASRLPQLYHPLFETESFARASRDRFVICIEASDARFEAASAERVLRETGADKVEWVRKG
jgi:hypothetical protein